MTESSLNELRQFFGGYFHQDWNIDAEDWDGVVAEFIQHCHGTDRAARIAALIDELIATSRSEAALERDLVEDLWCSYLPSADGLATRTWLTEVSAMLKSEETNRASPDDGHNPGDVHQGLATKRGETVDEAIARLNADPEFVARRAEQERVREERARLLAEAEAPLVAAIRAVGHQVDSVWDLVNTSSQYSSAIPVLLEHLLEPYPPAIKEGIARSLAVPEARKHWRTLRDLYYLEQDERAKDGLAIAVAGAADASCFDEIVQLLYDERLGPSRLFLLTAVERSKDRRSRRVLEELAATEPDFKPEVTRSLRRMARTTR